MQSNTKIPSDAARIIDDELSLLVQDESHDLAPALRVELFQTLGPSAMEETHEFYARVGAKRLAVLTPADRVRARCGILTAQKVAWLWAQACHETELVNDMSGGPDESPAAQLDYFRQVQALSLEGFSVYEVPRPFIPGHILAMAELAMQSRVREPEKFLHEVNEWWQIYTSPIACQREFSIKMAAQEALYLSVLWQRYPHPREHDYGVDAAGQNQYASDQAQAPAGYAMLAYAGVFDQPDRIVDPAKRQEFWLWWLGWAIPTAFEIEGE